MDLKPGSRWASQVCDTELIVVRPSTATVELECGGHPMVPVGADPAPGLTLDLSLEGGSPVGKRFVHEDSGLEVLVTKAGEGTLTVDGAVIPLKEAKALPSSD